MRKHGDPPYLECSSRGDKRFSAFFATVNGKSIESQYQAFKIFKNGKTGLSWKQSKGKKALNQEAANLFYSKLWDQYIVEHPELMLVLALSSGLSDMFGKPWHCCQATELWRIKCAAP